MEVAFASLVSRSAGSVRALFGTSAEAFRAFAVATSELADERRPTCTAL